MLYLGNNKVKEIYVGTQKANQLFLGTNGVLGQEIVWERTIPTHTWKTQIITNSDPIEIDSSITAIRLYPNAIFTETGFVYNVIKNDEVPRFEYGDVYTEYTLPTTVGVHQLSYPATNTFTRIDGTDLISNIIALDTQQYNYLNITSDGRKFLYGVRKTYYEFTYSSQGLVEVTSFDPNAYPDNSYQYDPIDNKYYWYVRRTQ